MKMRSAAGWKHFSQISVEDWSISWDLNSAHFQHVSRFIKPLVKWSFYKGPLRQTQASKRKMSHLAGSKKPESWASYIFIPKLLCTSNYLFLLKGSFYFLTLYWGNINCKTLQRFSSRQFVEIKTRNINYLQLNFL